MDPGVVYSSSLGVRCQSQRVFPPDDVTLECHQYTSFCTSRSVRWTGLAVRLSATRGTETTGIGVVGVVGGGVGRRAAEATSGA